MELEVLESKPDSEVVASRIVKAPIEMVFNAWIDPDHLKNWWGPNGFTNTFKTFDLREGGSWSFTMHGPNNDHYSNECVFVKIQHPDWIVLNHVSNPQFQAEGIFSKISDNETRVTFKQKFSTAKECDNLRAFVTGKNEENLDRLEAELERMK